MSKKLYIGVSGWSYKDWVGPVYPSGGKRRIDQLAFLSDFLDAVEVNSTFYRPPSAQMTASWVRRTASHGDFRFTAKLYQRFTHQLDKPYTGDDVDVFKRGIDPLAQSGRFGGLLVQFPWSFKNTPESCGYVARLADDFSDYPRFIEVRHGSWLAAEAMTLFAELGLGFCNIDQPVIGRSVGLTSVVTSGAAYMRLHGRNYGEWFKKDHTRDTRYDYLYKGAEIDEVADKVRDLLRQVDAVYSFNNNHYRGQAPANALQLKARLTGEKVPVPGELQEAFPFLKALARTPRGDTGQLF